MRRQDSPTKASGMLDELAGYLERDQGIIPSYAERHLAGEPISSATAEATVNLVIAKPMVKKQQILDHQLDHDIHRWYSRTPTPTEIPAAA